MEHSKTNIKQSGTLKLYIKTFGCQMNFADSDEMGRAFKERGFHFVPTEEAADAILVNTCTVRDLAEHKASSYIGRLRDWKEGHPERLIVVTGCAAERAKAEFRQRFSHIDLIVGAKDIAEFPKELDAFLQKINLDGDFTLTPTLALPAAETSPVTQYVTIMRGCNYNCTYCIVPYTRGTEISRSSESILKEMKDLETRGFKDVMLLGQNVNSYGKGLQGESIDFAGLLQKIQEAAPGIPRLRFITSHPKDAHTRLFQAMRDLPMVCEHLHLPVQSGSDRILRRMKREHTAQWYIDQIDEYRRLVPDGTLTSDFILGFPGETDKDFEETLALIERAQFDALYVFTYSPRPGTPALKLDDDVSFEEKNRRLQTVFALQKSISMKKNQALIGRTFDVLFESVTTKAEDRYVGRTRGYKRVVAASPENLVGRFRNVRITAVADETLIGECV
jgi:tRNA-2-methylthio-N6-dimethylallyladenosine synthase